MESVSRARSRARPMNGTPPATSLVSRELVSREPGETPPDDRGPEAATPPGDASSPIDAGVTALIPAYDEAERVGAVVEATLRHVRSVLVVDDGSGDGTHDAARRAGAEVVRHAA